MTRYVHGILPSLPDGVSEERVCATRIRTVGGVSMAEIDVVESVPAPYTDWRRVDQSYVPRHDEQLVTYMTGGAYVSGVPTTKTVTYRLNGDVWSRA